MPSAVTQLDRRTDSGRRGVALAALMAVGAILAEPAAAQTLRGRIVDTVSGDPVTLTFVALLEEGREMVVSTLGASDGSFSLTAPDDGSYLLYVARSGYGTVMDGIL